MSPGNKGLENGKHPRNTRKIKWVKLLSKVRRQGGKPSGLTGYMVTSESGSFPRHLAQSQMTGGEEGRAGKEAEAGGADRGRELGKNRTDGERPADLCPR